MEIASDARLLADAKLNLNKIREETINYILDHKHSILDKVAECDREYHNRPKYEKILINDMKERIIQYVNSCKNHPKMSSKLWAEIVLQKNYINKTTINDDTRAYVLKAFLRIYKWLYPELEQTHEFMFLFRQFHFMLRAKVEVLQDVAGDGRCFWNALWEKGFREFKHPYKTESLLEIHVRGPCSLRLACLCQFLIDDNYVLPRGEIGLKTIKTLKIEAFIEYIQQMSLWNTKVQELIIDRVSKYFDVCVLIIPYPDMAPSANLLGAHIDEMNDYTGHTRGEYGLNRLNECRAPIVIANTDRGHYNATYDCKLTPADIRIIITSPYSFKMGSAAHYK